jgi:hypothetical protein
MPLPLVIAAALRYAPELAGLLRGEKASEVVGRVLEKVAGASDEGALKRVEEDPKLAMDFRLELLGRQTELEALFLADVANARGRDIEVRRISGGGNERANWMIGLAALGTIGGIAAMIGLGLMKARYPDSLTEGVFAALSTQLGTINAAFILCLRDAFQFEFGSSRGSRIKDETERAKAQGELNG